MWDVGTQMLGFKRAAAGTVKLLCANDLRMIQMQQPPPLILTFHHSGLTVHTTTTSTYQMLSFGNIPFLKWLTVYACPQMKVHAKLG